MAILYFDQVPSADLDLYSLVDKAKQHLNKGQRELALFCIKQKKAVVEVLSRRLGNLETLQAILLKIEHAETEMEVIRRNVMYVTRLDVW